MTFSPLRKALIPVAGLGTRLFPATHLVKKEFFPVVGRDGIARPIILEIILEALLAGVEEVILVAQPADLEILHRFFTDQVPSETLSKLPDSLIHEAERLIEVGERIRFAIQESQEGFGHAVWSARALIGAEPFLLMLGDHLYRSELAESCAAQLARMYRQLGGNVVGLARTSEDALASRGAVGGNWQSQDGLLAISQFVEKPSLDYAREHLRVPSLPEEQYLVLFGQYILQPVIFDYLAHQIRENNRERGEFQFTTALEALRNDYGCLGYLIEGATYDIGQPNLYVDTLQAYRAS